MAEVILHPGVVRLVDSNQAIFIVRISLWELKQAPNHDKRPPFETIIGTSQVFFRGCHSSAKYLGVKSRQRSIPHFGVRANGQNELATGKRRIERLVGVGEAEGNILKGVGRVAVVDDTRKVATRPVGDEALCNNLQRGQELILDIFNSCGVHNEFLISEI